MNFFLKMTSFEIPVENGLMIDTKFEFAKMILKKYNNYLLNNFLSSFNNFKYTSF